MLAGQAPMAAERHVSTTQKGAREAKHHERCGTPHLVASSAWQGYMTSHSPTHVYYSAGSRFARLLDDDGEGKVW